MESVLVTGGAGFIGSHLVEELVKMNVKVIVFDDLSNGSVENLQAVLKDITFIQADVSKTHFDIKDNFDVIFHLATHPRSSSLSDPYRNLEVNAMGMLNVLELARRKDSKVIYTSNSGIYGEPQYLPVDENHPDDPKTPYDATKLFGEHLAKIYFRIYGIPVTTFRLATVFGERQRINEKLNWKPVVIEFITRVLKGESPIIYGDGMQTRDFIYVKDVVRGLILGAKSNAGCGEIFNLSTGKETTIKELFKQITALLGVEIIPRYAPPLPGDIKRMVYSYEKAKRTFKYEPYYSLEESLKICINWCKKNIDRF